MNESHPQAGLTPVKSQQSEVLFRQGALTSATNNPEPQWLNTTTGTHCSLSLPQQCAALPGPSPQVAAQSPDALPSCSLSYSLPAP